MSIVKDLLFIILFLIALIILRKNIRLRQELFGQRETFIKTLSHDLRVSTLAQIRGIDLLQSQFKHEAVQKELIDDIDESCKYSLDMINMLLNTYRYENGEQVLNYEVFNFSELVAEGCKNLSPKAKEKEVSLFCGMDCSVPVQADRMELEKALRYLVSTSIFNSSRKSNIAILAKIVDDSLEVSISYSGVPLTEEECKRMFSNNPRFSTVGHGIKMHLCKKIIEFHGGKIAVKNQGKINSFTFVIPAIKTSFSAKPILNSKLEPFSL